MAEAPRGTLLHHYRVDGDGIVQWANLVIATGHNNLAMNKSVAQVARHYVKADRLTEPMLNRVEAVIRCYDPCLSCSTHAIGQMPLHLQLLALMGPCWTSANGDRRVLVVGYGNPCAPTTASAGTPPGCSPPTPAWKAPGSSPATSSPRAGRRRQPGVAGRAGRCAAEGDPGSVSVRRIGPRSATPASWSHHLDPETLAGLADPSTVRCPRSCWSVSPPARSPKATASPTPCSGRCARSSRWSPGSSPVSTAPEPALPPPTGGTSDHPWRKRWRAPR